MQEAGYRTLIAGKWQLNGHYHDLPGFQDTTRPLKAGFDESILWQVTRDKKFGERYADPLIEENGKILPKMIGQYGPSVFADYICNFMERNKDRPFFVYYPMVLTHDPFVPTPDSVEWASGDRYQKDNRFFVDMVAYADKIVGQIDAKLGDLGIREKTILLFTADNGTNRSLTSRMKDGTVVAGGKGTTPDAGTHVPFVATWPGTAPNGIVNDDLIDFSDFLPTLADIAGRKETDNDGRSFLPQLRGEEGDPRTYMFCHYDPRWGSNSDHKNRFARNQVYKLYLDGRMYNIPADVLEKEALKPADLSSSEIRQQLQKVLDSMPPWDPKPERQ
jgi:arylsulfatase A